MQVDTDYLVSLEPESSQKDFLLKHSRPLSPQFKPRKRKERPRDQYREIWDPEKAIGRGNIPLIHFSWWWRWWLNRRRGQPEKQSLCLSDQGSVHRLGDLDNCEFIGNCFDHTILVTQTDKWSVFMDTGCSVPKRKSFDDKMMSNTSS